MKHFKTAPPMSGDKSKILREKLGDKYIHEQAIRYAVYDAMQEYADQQNAALKESLAELIPIADDCIHLIKALNMDRVKVITVEKYKAVIDRAKKLIAESRE